tara:strand:- start:1950 stop:2915 length:966 start_codon:yes stop_codon:yes gene_type:complete
MNQYYSNDFTVDPSRQMWENYKNESPERLQNNKKNIFIQIKNKDKDKTAIQKNNNPLVSESYNKLETIHSELFEKDKENQKLKFKIKQLEVSLDNFKEKLGAIKVLRQENNNLLQKLEEEYKKNRELPILKNKILFLEKMKKEDTRKIKELSRKVPKDNQKETTIDSLIDTIKGEGNEDNNEEDFDINGDIDEESESDGDSDEEKDSDEESDEEKDSDEESEGSNSEYGGTYKVKSMELEEINTDEYNYNLIFNKMMEERENIVKDNNVYENDKLKRIICKYINNIKESKIDSIFRNMKITKDTIINHKLISDIILQLKGI